MSNPNAPKSPVCGLNRFRLWLGGVLIAALVIGLGYAICPQRPLGCPEAMAVSALGRSACEQVFRDYSPILEGSDIISGSPCWAVRLKPNVKGRAWRQLWIDQKTGTLRGVREWTGDDHIKSAILLGKP